MSLSRHSGLVCIEVADTGQGITPDFLPKVFDMFSQPEGGGRRDRGGLGIGLSLVKQLAEMHAGRIEAESGGLGRGARFRLWLPETPVSHFRAGPDDLIDPQILKGVRVLLVDDALEGLEALRTLLEIEGAQAEAVDSGERALAAAAAKDFDLVLSGIGGPTMNGFELVAALRKSPRTANVPAIAITEFGRKQDVADALRAGFNGHLGKPVELQSLIDEIARVVARLL